MIICPNCNRETPGYTKFCSFCGKKMPEHDEFKRGLMIVEIEDIIREYTGKKYNISMEDNLCNEKRHKLYAILLKSLKSVQYILPEFEGAKFCGDCGTELPQV